MTARHYLVVGSGKSGTTALYTAIKRALPEDAKTFFEPRKPEVVRAIPEEPGVTLTKLLAENFYEGVPLEGFDRRVLILRDPRDVLVSRVLYQNRDLPLFKDDAKVRQLLEALEHKERHPTNTGILDLLELVQGLLGREDYVEKVNLKTRLTLEALEKVASHDGDLFVLRYEDFVEGRVEELSRYLGLPIEADVKVEREYARVERTKGHGDWKNWFTARDVEAFRPVYQSFLERFGYDDWELSADPTVSASTSSAYVRRIINEKRQKRGLPAI